MHPHQAPEAPTDTDPRAPFASLPAACLFIGAGRATVTLVSKRTGQRYTFKFARPPWDPAAAHKPRPVWVRLLTGPDNTADFTFLGTLWPETNPLLPGQPVRFRAKDPSRNQPHAQAVLAITWLARMIGFADENRLFAQAELWHEGRCGRCGRKLTVPSSIESGFGPECINHVEN